MTNDIRNWYNILEENFSEINTLTSIREFLEPLWKSWKTSRNVSDESISFGMCRFTVAFLLPIIEQMTNNKWWIDGGLSHFHPSDPGWNGKGSPQSSWSNEDGVGGMIDVNDKWQDHYWLTNGTMIIDITADQFGWEPIIITKSTDSRYLANWKKSSIREHISEVKPRATEWRKKWYERNNIFENANDDMSGLPSVSKIKQIVPVILDKAQTVYDDWVQGEDDDLNGGGICHLIADEICHVLGALGFECQTVTDTEVQHVYTVVQGNDAVCMVDIPYHIYEYGSMFSWTKIPDVHFDNADVIITILDHNPENFYKYVD